MHLNHRREQAVRIADPGAENSEAMANLEPRVHDDNRSGLRETRFRVQRIEPVWGSNATRIVLQLGCDRVLTPWCEQAPASSLLQPANGD